ncbi:MerR family transcriptional regulator [Chryseomicrobium sp. FSL W7-1435]|uniref:MerR family transcriptional regulator n=1 Tax=Chryseomicrobium sp. FSL W7-1435 TaxID=2921704 RepID=UPI003159A976
MLTIKQLADISGVTTRTLRHYDEIGLLKPAELSDAGYRLYSEKEVDQLQQILFFRELEFPLQVILTLLKEQKFDELLVFENHRKLLLKKQKRLTEILETLEKTIEAKRGGSTMTNEEKFTGLKTRLIAENEERYGAEVRENYGDAVVDASNAKMMGLSEEDFQQMKHIELELLEILKHATPANDVESKEAKQLVDLHKAWISYTWPQYSADAHKGLAEMYVADERFSHYYNQHVPGAAEYLRNSIHRWAK